jgi:23S rRNA (pseudouridine1915-N3)-methyltransferase
MMNVNIIAVGNLKENYFVKACAEYSKRLSAFVKLNIIEIKESLLKQNAKVAEIEKAKKEEAEQIIKKAKGFLIALEVEGKSLTSEQLAQKINTLNISGVSEISFIIGGSNGLDKAFSDSCDMKLSFSTFTFPHQLMRVILLEQIYRAMCINNNKIYHK